MSRIYRPARRVRSSSSHRKGQFGPMMSRRNLLIGGASLASLAALPRWARAHGGAVRRSRHGLLDTHLNVHFASNRIGDREVFTRTFEGGITGPTLRVRPGDTLRIRLSNFLPPDVEEEVKDINIPHGFNTTNLHTHGLHVSPNCSADGSVCSDNVLIEVHPGETQQYEYHLPVNHPDGTFWYHPHKHGSAAVQFMGGMAGALIVEGESDVFLRRRGIVKDQVFVLQQIRVKEDGEVRVEHFDDFLEPPIFTLNGQLQPVIRIRPGEIARWRFINGGMSDHVPLELRDRRGNRLPLHQFACDGITLPRLEEVEQIFMASGNRVDVLAQINRHGVYHLVKPEVLQFPEAPTPEEHIATVVVAGRRQRMRMPGGDLPRPASLPFIPDDELTGSRELEFGADFGPLIQGEPFPRFLIDGKQFDPDRIDQRMKLGAVEEWTIFNTGIDHPFHIHQNHFVVTQRNEQPLDQPKWLDTITVPAADFSVMPPVPGSVTFRTRFEDFAGRFVLHCHILDHEDLGMMQLVEVV